MTLDYDRMAKILKVIDEYTVVINRGETDGVTEGQKYLVFGLGEELFDPDTGENLGQLELVRGKAEVIHVQPSLATLRSIHRRPTSQIRRVIRRPRNALNILGAAGGMYEEIEEPPEYVVAELEAEEGDLAKRI